MAQTTIPPCRKRRTQSSSGWFLLLLWLSCLSSTCLGRSGNSNWNPYKVLGVSRDATEEEIRRNYRKLCLKYHPDKNVSKSKRERQKCEEMFKRVQKANSQIGDEESRRQYESGFSSQYSDYEYQNRQYNSPMDDMFRAFGGYPGAGRNNYFRNAGGRTPIYVNGIDITQLFSRGFGGPSFTRDPSSSFRSTYVQEVTVPLEDLYKGGKEADFVLHDNIWKRYRAAFRGGLAAPLTVQALGMSFPLLFRVRFPIMLACFGLLFHASLPRPTTLHYQAELRKGWKGGTKLKFEDVDPGFVIVFVLKEGKHERFKRVGNDLTTIVNMSRKQAREGCTLEIETMDELELPVTLELRPNQIQQSGDVVRIKGKGWPRKQNRGDLLVIVNLGRSRKRHFTF